MTKKVIVKKDDGGIIVICPVLEKFGDEDGKRPFSDLPALKEYPGLEWYVTEEDIDKSDLESRKQLYWEDNGDGTTAIKKDLAWEKRVMPDQLIKKKLIERMDSEIDELLLADTPDPVVVLSKQREMDKIKKLKAGPQNEDVYWMNKAIEGLDKKVAKGEEDKPQIREKIQQKINDLNSLNS